MADGTQPVLNSNKRLNVHFSETSLLCTFPIISEGENGTRLLTLLLEMRSDCWVLWTAARSASQALPTASGAHWGHLCLFSLTVLTAHILRFSHPCRRGVHLTTVLCQLFGQSLINGGNAPFYNFSEFESLLLIHLLGLGIITSVKVLRRSLSVTAFSVALPISDYLSLCGHRGSSWASQRLLRSQNSLSTLCRHYYYYYYYYYYYLCLHL